MKKLFLMIATVALMTACNGNSNTSANASGEKTDSASVAQNNEAASEATAGEAVENDFFKITNIPNGWEKDAELESERRIDIKLKPGTDLGEWQYVEVEHEDFQDVKEWLDQVLSYESESTKMNAYDSREKLKYGIYTIMKVMDPNIRNAFWTRLTK